VDAVVGEGGGGFWAQADEQLFYLEGVVGEEGLVPLQQTHIRRISRPPNLIIRNPQQLLLPLHIPHPLPQPRLLFLLYFCLIHISVILGYWEARFFLRDEGSRQGG